MAFELPDYSSLNPQQQQMVSLPTSRNFMIKGSPGTGKTVVAIYRAAQMRNKNILMLVYNRPLMMYLSSAMDELGLTNSKVNTYHSWMNEFYKKKFGTKPPKITTYEFNWNQVLKDCQGIAPMYDHIIIDEAQDFPKELITVLTKVAKNVTCFIDSNQAIEANKTDVIEAVERLCIEAPFTLEYNYRNTNEIAAVSKLYWNQEGFFAKPRRKGNRLPSMISCVDFEDQTEMICDIIRDNKDKTIGVFVNNKSLNVTYDELSDELYGEVDVEVYKSMGAKSNINFNTNGVKILSYGTMKGLEFDIVILAMFDKVKSTDDYVADQNRAYVATSRARNDLYICYFSKKCSSKWIDTMSKITSNTHLFQWN